MRASFVVRYVCKFDISDSGMLAACIRKGLNVLENRCDALSTADTHCYQRPFLAGSIQLVERLDHKDRTSRANRVAE